MDIASIFTATQVPVGLNSLWTAFGLALAACTTCLAYRAFFSPLACISGPFLNRISNLPLQYHMLRGHYHWYSTQLHARYGDMVRMGIDHVSLSNTADTRRVLATHAFRKGRMYNQIESNGYGVNTFSTVDPEVNKLRRRLIGDAFAMHTMRQVEGLIVESGASALIKLWDSEIASQGGIARINYFYTFHRMGYDVIGELAFGRTFNTLPTGDMELIDWIHDSIKLSILIGQAPIITKFLWVFRRLVDSTKKIQRLVHDTIETRKKLIREAGKPPRVDVLQKFIDAKDMETSNVLLPVQLESEVRLTLLAGSDTTSNTLSFTIMNLMHYPEHYRRVTDEVRSAFPDTSKMISFADAKAKLPYLTAVIYESMRLNPSLANMLQRSVPAEGAIFQNCFLPGDTQICISISACHRNPQLWNNPDVFDPERFLGPDSAERIKDILTFSSGVRACIAKNMVMLELYTALANTLRRYNFSLPADSMYGPHRLDRNEIPVEIPSSSFIVTGPTSPKAHCWVNISRA
ncbi:cytochrome P450 [Linderina pennispora]|uniref:Cytochrome P450 n=1 Tax=Linderina pennispora TaxID=61395 RepID=A0A1Y1W0K8_9FUNG|nr:cytochrome P450 [Linderina pennispora]ORX67060.1 cytochrome P450 [Linderina pennispora]